MQQDVHGVVQVVKVVGLRDCVHFGICYGKGKWDVDFSDVVSGYRRPTAQQNQVGDEECKSRDLHYRYYTACRYRQSFQKGLESYDIIRLCVLSAPQVVLFPEVRAMLRSVGQTAQKTCLSPAAGLDFL